jgi:8-oxo-dGTP pyrophosphatase MutT (NUDIX family)
MDLTLPAGDIVLNIRVAVIVKTEHGYVLEKSKGGYYFVTGGRIKTNETSEEAARREIFEELGITLDHLKLKAVIELFFGPTEKRVQEICFVYSTTEVNALALHGAFGEYTIDQIKKLDVRPIVIQQVIDSSDDEILHISHRE